MHKCFEMVCDVVLFMLVSGCQLDRDPPAILRPLALPCITSSLRDGRIILATCPDPRHRERTFSNDAGYWCECPKIIVGEPPRGFDFDAGGNCGTEYVSRYPDGRHPYERLKVCTP